MQKPFAVRVTLTHKTGTIERRYERGTMRVTKEAFASFALGDLLMVTRLAEDPQSWGRKPEPLLSWTVVEEASPEGS